MEELDGHLRDILTLQQDDDKESKRQALRLVILMKAQSEGLASDYMRFQGSPFSNSDYKLETLVEGLPTLEDLHTNSTNSWQRISVSLTAFALLATWFERVLLWQVDLTPKATEMHQRLETCHQQSKALCTSLASILGQKEPTYHPKTVAPKVFAKKVIGYEVCRGYVSWLTKTEKDLVILVSETAV